MAIDEMKSLYNKDLVSLEKLLFSIKRPGHFFFHGTMEIPMPKMEVEGVGILSFPIPKEQIKQMIDQAVRAPYGRGKETLLDMEVRKVWQLKPEMLKISSPSWVSHLKSILKEVKEGLGCQGITVTAECYKLLIYDRGGFFLSHRDTEKSQGMFGTLVIVLPSFHQGGDLVIRHAGQEVTINLSNSEGSQLKFAAFYADCEHEVRPVTEGNRVCLVYNLIQSQEKGEQEPLHAPLYDKEIEQAASMLKKAFKKQEAPAKIAWLFEHQYSSAELSFATLKNADAARAQVLIEAANQAECTIYLGIVHIEESGAAEPSYDFYSSRRRSKWWDDEEEEEEDDDEEFEVIEVSDSEQYIDGWINLNNQPVPFGQIPLEEGELLPKGSLDNEKPDEQKLMEASGNEGASFERAYRRAALIIWPKKATAEVLLQAGVEAIMPHFKEQIELKASSKEISSLAQLILDEWENDVSSDNYHLFRRKTGSSIRCEMLILLNRLENSALLERFISTILSRAYDGTENEILKTSIPLIERHRIENVLSSLISANMAKSYDKCLSLVSHLLEEADQIPSLLMTLRSVMQLMVASLKDIQPRSSSPSNGWQLKKEDPTFVEPAFIVELWQILQKLKATDLEKEAVETIIQHPSIFDPGKTLVPALKRMQNDDQNQNLFKIWQHASEFLLKRSEYPLQAPKDWKQEVKLSCQCEDCRKLQAFIYDPSHQTLRLPAGKERRQHLHNQIDRHHLEMTHETERVGRPFTLVCQKTREKYEKALKQYHEDVEKMRELLSCFRNDFDEPMNHLRSRLTSAAAREK